MIERGPLMRALRGALQDATRPGGILHPHLDLPRITVFDPPIKRRRKGLTGRTVETAHDKRRCKRRSRTVAPEQLRLL